MPKNVVHTVRGFHMSAAYAEQVMREHCTIAWDVKGVSVRDTTDEERINLRAEQARQTKITEGLLEILGIQAELASTRFVPPTTTKYRAPREAYEELESPLGVKTCRWPRISCAQ